MPFWRTIRATEAHPLGRCEWIKVYGALLGKSEEAEALFAAQKKYLDAVAEMEETGEKTVAFSTSTPLGKRCAAAAATMFQNDRPGRGRECVPGLENDGSARSTVTMEMEKFYEEARDADVVIYNSTLGGDVQTLEELLGKMHCWRISRQCAVVTCGVPVTIFIGNHASGRNDL